MPATPKPPLIDIRPDHWDIVRDILQKHVPQYEVWAFGSRAKWTAKEYSDLDLAVITDKPLSLSVSAALADDFSESDLPWKVDVVDWATTSESFRKIIERDRMVVLKKKGVAGETLFAIPSNWESTTLGEACKRGGGDIQTGPFGSQLHAADYVSNGIPSIMPQNIGDNRISDDGIARITDEDAQRLSRYLVRAGDIVYSRRGDVERRALIREREEGWLCGTGCLRVRFGMGVVYPPYAAHYLGHPLVREWIVRHAHGATMPNLNTSILSALPFVLPPHDEQRAIAHILGTLDDKIELNRRMNETLEAIARAIFTSWFVDFDPVRAKASGEPPESICRRLGLTPDLLALFSDRLVDSELGEIPEGWCVATVDDEFHLTMGQSPPGNTYNEMGEGLPFYQGRTDFGFRFPTRRVFCTAPTRLAEIGDTLISVRAPVGDINMSDEKCCIGRGVAAARHKSGSRSYTYYFMQSIDDVFNRFEADGTVFGSISKKDFHKIERTMPPIETVQAFERLAAPIDDELANMSEQSRTLAALRDTLLPKLLSGELRVSHLENTQEEELA